MNKYRAGASHLVGDKNSEMNSTILPIIFQHRMLSHPIARIDIAPGSWSKSVVHRRRYEIRGRAPELKENL
jgi:hypothetical protein